MTENIDQHPLRYANLTRMVEDVLFARTLRGENAGTLYDSVEVAESLLRQIDPTEPPTSDDWFLLNVHAEIQRARPDVSVEHRNIVLNAISKVLRANNR